MNSEGYTMIMLNDGRDMGMRWLTPADRALAMEFAGCLEPLQCPNLSHDLDDPEAMSMRMDLLGQGRVALIAAIDLAEPNQAAGLAMLKTGAHSNAHRASVQCYVRPEYQDLGLGSNLMRALEEKADELELMILQVEIRVDHQDLIVACKRLGFQLKAVLEDFRVDSAGEPYDVIIMLKRLKRQGDKEFLYRY